MTKFDLKETSNIVVSTAIGIVIIFIDFCPRSDYEATGKNKTKRPTYVRNNTHRQLSEQKAVVSSGPTKPPSPPAPPYIR